MKTGSISATTKCAVFAHSRNEIKRLAAFALALGVAIGFGVATPSAQAQTFTQLYAFQGVPDGEAPYGGLAIDANGNLYGTTTEGGKVSCGGNGCGTVFKLAGTKESWVYSFQGPPDDGATPGYVNLIPDGKGNYYGTTGYGGDGPCKPGGTLEGCGTVFKITSAGKEKVLYNFQYGPNDGAGPDGSLVMDSSGNLYGTTVGGGNITGGCSQQGCGTVFEITAAGKEKLLYKFCPNPTAKCPDGAGPLGALVRDSAGNLYGTTAGGGLNLGGTVFEVTPSGKEKVLYNFCSKANCRDGGFPNGGLALDEATGILYGTTVTGGKGVCGQETSGGGTVFQISTSDKNFLVLHSFDSSTGDGCNPFGTVTLDKAGNLYGTTLVGGSASGGTVWMISGGSESVLYNFNFDGIGGYGSTPVDALIVDSKSNLYGTTIGGGGASACTEVIDGLEVGGCGTVFELTP